MIKYKTIAGSSEIQEVEILDETDYFIWVDKDIGRIMVPKITLLFQYWDEKEQAKEHILSENIKVIRRCELEIKAAKQKIKDLDKY